MTLQDHALDVDKRSRIEAAIDMSDEDVLLYTRMSVVAGEGIERQRDETVPYVERQGLKVLDEWSDDGKSATKDTVKRDAFETIIEIAKARRQKHGPSTFTRVAVWHSDRFARRVKDLLRVEEAGILLYGKNSGYFDLSTPAGVATAITITAWAEYEGKQKALRQRASNKQRAEKGRPYWPTRPFGYNLDGTLHPQESKLLRAAYRDVLAGTSLHSICKEWNEKGITTTTGGKWGITSLRTLLLAPRNAGISTYLRIEVGKGNWSKLIDEDVLRAMERYFANPSRRTRPQYEGRMNLLSGIAKCAKCGEPVVAKARPSGYRYYTCKRGCCTAVQEWTDDRAQALLLQRLSGDRSIMERLQDNEHEDVEVLRAEVERLERKAAEYRDMFKSDEISRVEFNELNNENKELLATVQEKLTAIGLNEALHELVGKGDLKGYWYDVMTMERRSAVVRQFFEDIVIKPRGKGRGGNGRGAQMEKGDVEFYIAGYPEPLL